MLAPVHLVYSVDCTVEDAADARNDLVATNAFQGTVDAVIRQWTVSGMKLFEMCRLISDRLAPLKLGLPDRPKVSACMWIVALVRTTISATESGREIELSTDSIPAHQHSLGLTKRTYIDPFANGPMFF